MKLRKNEITSPNCCFFPPLENKLSSVGKLKSLPRDFFVPPLEPKSSSAGTEKFQGRNRLGAFTKAFVSTQKVAMRTTCEAFL